MWAVPWAFTALGAVPLAFLLWKRLDRAWWWMASGFAVSVLADLAGRAGYAYPASQVYPVLQCALVAVPMTDRRTLVRFVALMLAAASASVVWREGVGLDVALRAVAFGGVAVLAWRGVAHDPLRTALVAYFGGGLLAYLCYGATPGWVTYLGMQGVRVAGIGLWCVAAWRVAGWKRAG